jgi:hypothetical protein
MMSLTPSVGCEGTLPKSPRHIKITERPPGARFRCVAVWTDLIMRVRHESLDGRRFFRRNTLQAVVTKLSTPLDP